MLVQYLNYPRAPYGWFGCDKFEAFESEKGKLILKELQTSTKKRLKEAITEAKGGEIFHTFVAVYQLWIGTVFAAFLALTHTHASSPCRSITGARPQKHEKSGHTGHTQRAPTKGECSDFVEFQNLPVVSATYEELQVGHIKCCQCLEWRTATFLPGDVDGKADWHCANGYLVGGRQSVFVV